MDETAWWKEAVIYQIYPRSFYDANGDGVGDLRGIFEKLPYLADLSVDSVWLSPVFKSPMLDFGYDISDHCAIDPLVGSMSDFDGVLAEAHRLGLKLILDLVPNHLLFDHPWFRTAAAPVAPSLGIGTSGVIRLPGGPPTNWLSAFGGSGWQFDDATEQYYYHTFLTSQPDLTGEIPMSEKLSKRSCVSGLPKA